ncbi:MAG: hypothetical protein HY043_08950 [Verrucomicrobia bacterium]|nr:hypothetical protein [Verrucomicrobiota bacterium]
MTEAQKPKSAIKAFNYAAVVHVYVVVAKCLKRICKPSVVGSNPTTGSISFIIVFIKLGCAANWDIHAYAVHVAQTGSCRRRFAQAMEVFAIV